MSSSPPEPPRASDPASARLFGRRFVALLAMQMAFGFAISTFLLLPKVLAVSLGARAGAIGLVMAGFGVGSVVAVPFMVRHIGRHGARPSILVGNVLMFAGAIGFAFVEGAGPLAIFLRALHGAAWTIVFNGGLTLAAQIAPAGRLAQALGIYGSANLATNALSPAIAEPLIDRFGFRPVFVAAGALAVLSFELARRLRDVPTPSVAAPVGLVALLRRPTVQRLGVLATVTGLALGVMFTFSTPFALEQGARQVRGFFVGYTVAALLVRLGTGRLADRMGHHLATRVSLVVYGLVVAAAATLDPATLAIFGFAFGLAHGMFFPAAMALAAASAEPHERGQVLAVMNGGLAAGMGLVSLLGPIAEGVGYPVVFLAAGAATLLLWPVVPRADPVPPITR